MTVRHTSAFAALAFLCASAAAQNPGFAPEDIARGSKIYAANCRTCHGARMNGPEWGIDLKTFPKDERARFIDSVTNGKNAMPPWGDVLKADEIASLWAYVVAGETK